MAQSKPRTENSTYVRSAACYARALRMPFLTASILPFLAGTYLYSGRISYLKFFIGLLSAITTHLGANLINDYADSKSGADWHDKKFYGFFGGSKLIQEEILSEKFYLIGAICCFLIAFVSVGILSLLHNSLSVSGFYLLILFLGVSYSQKPLQFSYRYLGEPIIFTLFGPALVMGGYFIQSGVFPTLPGFILSLPFGFLTTGILFANEVPDYSADIASKKITWVNLTGQSKAYILYYALMFSGMIFIFLNILIGTLPFISALSLIFVPLVIKSGRILKKYYNNKQRLIEASKLTILIQTVISLIVVVGLIL